MEVTIVPMRQEHTAQIAALEAVCFSDPWPESILQKELDNPLSLWLCAMDGDTIAGYVGSQTVLGEADGDYVLRVRCSKGTYIRTLCHDIGAALGCGGVMSALRRTEVGGYRVEDAHTMDELCALPREAAQRLLLPVDSLWPDAPQVTVDAKAERLARCGNPFTLSAPDGTYRIYAASGEFLLLAQVTDGTAVTIKSFFEVS